MLVLVLLQVPLVLLYREVDMNINDAVYCLFEEMSVVKREETKNYNIKDYKNPPDKDIQKDPETGKSMYRRKVVYGNDGKKHILTLAIKKASGKKGGMTQVTSKWTKK